MALEPGGRGDKLGNRYEGRWVARQLLYVLAGEYQSVMIEGIGDDEAGVDLWVTHKDGEREAQQCKANNGNEGKWTIRDLDRRGVLPHLHKQLARGPEYRYTLVSGVDAPDLRSLADRARRSGGNAAAFAQEQIKAAPHRAAFESFCHCLGIAPSSSEGIQKAHDLLSRTNVHTQSAGPDGERDIRMVCQVRVDGDPRVVLPFLADFAVDHFAIEMDVAMLRGALAKRGFRLRNLALDLDLPGRIDQLRTEFDDSLRHLLVAGQMIPRPETQSILGKLLSSDAARIVVLHGKAGDGKSGVLLELTDHLREKGIPWLALRLDRRTPASSAQIYGKQECGLPDSPAVCLGEYTGGKLGVLILDQLDAIRWTSAHASVAWDVCKEIIDQALGFHHLRVVIACRTFDWKDDPQISNWSRLVKFEEVVVGPLPDDVVQSIVTHAGGDYAQFPSRERKLLCSVQALSMWLTMQAAGHAPRTFANTTELMRQFWSSAVDRLTRMGVSSVDRNGAVAAMVDYMDRSARLSAPARLADRYGAALPALGSLNIVTQSAGQVSFAHQSYLDYLIADRIWQQIVERKGTVTDWLCATDQSLFRREQLRQLLAMIRDTDPNDHAGVIRQLLDDTSIRFHLKHVILQHLGQADPASNPEVELTLSLWPRSEWREHLKTVTFWKKPAWFRALAARGVIRDWLGSDDVATINGTLWLMYLIVDQCGDLVAEHLEPYADATGEWPQRIWYVLQYAECIDSRRLFDLRLRAIRYHDVDKEHLHDPGLAKLPPSWCAELLEARLAALTRRWEAGHKDDDEEAAYPVFVPEHDFGTLATQAKAEPLEWWNRLVPLLLRLLGTCLTPGDADGYTKDEIWYGNRFSVSHRHHRDICDLLALAGGALAASNRPAFFAFFNECAKAPVRAVQRLLLLALLEAPNDYANWALSWLCENPARFKLDVWHEYRQEWLLARRLMGRFAALCSAPVYERLEATILAYHENYEWESFRWQYDESNHGSRTWRNYYAYPQHILLTALPVSRMTGRAASWADQLDRKYGSAIFRPDPREEGGMLPVRSRLPDDAVSRISDKEWRRVITAHPEDEESRMRQGNGCYEAVGAVYFGGQLATQTHREPQRFIRLTIKLPPDVKPAYLAAILDGLRHTSPPEKLDPHMVPHWRSATTAEIEQLLCAVQRNINDTDLAMTFCRLVEERSEEPWSDDALALLAHCATEHPNPGPDELMVRRVSKPEELTSGDLETNALNCVRACAANAIAAIVFERPAQIQFLKATILKIAEDVSPVVRTAALGICCNLLKTDRALAWEAFERAIEPDDLILATRFADFFLGHARREETEQAAPILARMASSHRAEVAEFGAGRTTGMWLQYGQFEDMVHAYVAGTVPQRTGVAHVASSWIKHEDYCQRCLALLDSMFSDEDRAVRQRASRVFGVIDVLSMPGLVRLASRYVTSLAFLDGASSLIHALEDHPGPLGEYAEVIFAACGRFADDLCDQSRDMGNSIYGDAQRLGPLLLRLYEQAQDRRDTETQRRCLDMWDKMLEARVAGAADIIERTER